MLVSAPVKDKIKLVFLGGIFPPSQYEFIQRESKGVVQNAADALQKSLIRGLAAHEREMIIVNLPYVGAYPRYFKKIVYPGTMEGFEGVPVFGQRFALVRFIKTIHRFFAAFGGLRQVDSGAKTVTIIYAAHGPFLMAAIAHKALRRNNLTCIVLPDLPEFMAEGGLLYRMVKSIDTAIFYRLARRIDYFVVLTKAMAERLNLPSSRYTVVEGIADQFTFDQPLDGSGPDRCVFMYAGTLAARYGIVDLLSAFGSVRSQRAELWICGEGDSKTRIEEAAAGDPRIRFFGQIPRDEVRKLQAVASVLVNPRRPEGEFTKYSFPSKTMEYMASGRPVLMHRLPGVPDEYHPYFMSPSDSSVAAFARAMEELACWSHDRLEEFGGRAKNFVLSEKTAFIQAGKILDMIDNNQKADSNVSRRPQ